jgi:hypothetical protein
MQPSQVPICFPAAVIIAFIHESSVIDLLEIAVKLRFDEDDSIEKLLHYFVFALSIRVTYRLELSFCLSVDCGLSIRCCARTLGVNKRKLGHIPA